jgi:hypothetical protein
LYIVGSDACHRGFKVGPEKVSRNPWAAIVELAIDAATNVQKARDLALLREFRVIIS